MTQLFTFLPRAQQWRLGALGIAALFALSGCGGGGGGSASPSSGVPLGGALIDGPIQGARVFLDLNGNLVHDEGEPLSGLTDATGAFTLDASALSASQLALAMLVSEVPADAKDADDGGLTLAQAGKQAFTMLAPASAFVEAAAGRISVARPAVVSPLTTLVAGEILNNGLKLDEAREAVKQEQGLARDPLENFVAARDAATANIARAAAVALGEAGRAVSQTARSEGQVAVRDQIQAVVQSVRDGLPAVTQGLSLQNAATPAPSVATLVTKIETEQKVATKAADRVAIQSTGLPAALANGQGSAPEFYDYVVVFKDSVGNPAQEASLAATPHRGTVRFTYTRALKGFAVRLPAAAGEAFLNAMDNNPNVAYVETDAPVNTRQTVQSNATWGLDRIDQRDLPLSASYSYSTAGSGVRAYVVDTGIHASHTDFGGRVVAGHNVVADTNGTSDCNGHGTHVAGTLGGSTHGVAKSVTLVPVRVLDCAGSGTLSGVIAGIDWVIGDTGRTGASVINLSLGGGASTSLDAAVAKAVATGISVVVAAGNDNANACNYSPAREPSAITVGASTSSDARASFSNFGSCLDVFAPGNGITSAWYTSNSDTRVLNGTSMAAPHVAGLAALILGSSPEATPAQVAELIRTTATPSKVTSAGSGSPNLLLYTLGSNSGGTTAPSTVSVSVAALVGTTSSLRNGWQATVSISVKDASGNPVGGAAVAGGFSVGGSSVSCTTATNGACSVRTGTIGKNTAQTVYTVSRIRGTGMSYDSSKNAASSVTLRKP